MWRAGLLLEGLEFKILAYMARKPVHVNIRPPIPPKDQGMVYYEVVVTEAIPTTLAPTVGDIIHNLRTSLDVLAYDLVRDKSGVDLTKVYFPFSGSATGLDEVIQRRQMDKATPEVIAHIKSLKPYTQHGNQSLCGVHALDIFDKHRSVLPAHGWVRIPYSESAPITPSAGVQWGGEQGTGILSQGHNRASNWPMGEKLPVVFKLTFPQEVPFAAQPLVETLKDLLQQFTGVIDSFESLCFGTVTKQFPWT